MTTERTTFCGIDGCGQPRHLTATGRADPTLCAAHDRMLSVLKSELIRRSGNSVGATELLGRVEAARVG
jgi:hypothetical protein